jgi:N2-acetyl-L-2,4-diaminobutanoate deacetylase
MRRIIVRPDGLDLDSPGRRDYRVALEHDSIWGDHLLPLTVLVGPDARPGRGLVAFGSNHGNESEGPVALKHLLGEIPLADVRGRILLVPVPNPSAFHASTRESADDGVNLNRAFMEGPAGRPPWRGSRTGSRPSCGSTSGRGATSSSTCTRAAMSPGSVLKQLNSGARRRLAL